MKKINIKYFIIFLLILLILGLLFKSPNSNIMMDEFSKIVTNKKNKKVKKNEISYEEIKNEIYEKGLKEIKDEFEKGIINEGNLWYYATETGDFSLLDKYMDSIKDKLYISNVDVGKVEEIQGIEGKKLPEVGKKHFILKIRIKGTGLNRGRIDKLNINKENENYSITLGEKLDGVEYNYELSDLKKGNNSYIEYEFYFVSENNSNFKKLIKLHEDLKEINSLDLVYDFTNTNNSKQIGKKYDFKVYTKE